MYHIILRDNFDKTIVGWYDASASNFSTDQRRAKHFFSRIDADLVADQLRRMYPRLAQDIEVTAVQPTGLTCTPTAVACCYDLIAGCLTLVRADIVCGPPW